MYDAKAEVLILGTFPSVGSVEGGGYYGSPRNDFWRIMSQILGPHRLSEPHFDPGSPRFWPWEARYRFARYHRVALWDVVKSCERKGPSSDGDLRGVAPNGIPWFLTKVPRVERILFTGRRSEELFRRHVLEPEDRHLVAWSGYRRTNRDGTLPDLILLETVPSPSRRNTMPYAEKVRAYRRAFRGVLL